MSRESIELPMSVLAVAGRVESDELANEGISLDIIDPDDVPGPWTRDYSSWPPENRPPVMPKPDIALALRSNYGGLKMSFSNVHGEELSITNGSLGATGGDWIRYFLAGPAFNEAAYLRITILRD